MNGIDILSEINDRNSVIIFGCGKYGKIIFKYLEKTKRHKKVVCFVDNKKKNIIDHYKQIKILYPDFAKELYKNSLWIISSPKNSSQMQRQLLEMDIKPSNILHPTEEEILLMYKLIHKYYYEEDKYFIYERGFPISIKFILILIKSFLWEKYYVNIMKKNILISNTDRRYKYNVSICGIFLNEAPYIKEWIEFHRMIGVEHFYLYNNMSTDNYKSILAAYITEGIVTLTDWDIPHGQISAYRDCVERFSFETRWIGFIDLDEFVVPRRNKIYDFLKQYNNYGSVLIYWKIYGSSGGKSRKLNDLVIEDFKKCWPKLMDYGKCFYNTSYTLSDNSKNGNGFYHICWTARNGKNLPPINAYGKFSFPGGIQIVSKEPVPIQINHYLTKSYNEYQKKIIQPDATFERNSRTDVLFYYYDRKATGTDNLINQYLPELKQRLKEKRDENQ